MAYTPTTWVDGSTKLGPTNLNHLETGVANALDKTDMTAKGDLLVATASGAYSRLAVGANDTVPVAASGQSTGVIWQQIGNAQVASGAAIAYSKLNLTGAILNADLAGSIALSKLATVVPYAYDRATSTVDVNTSTTETSIYTKTITGNDMSTNRALRLTALGDYLHNNVAGDTITLRIKFGGTTHYAVASALGAATGALRHPWYLVWVIQNLAAANSQCQTGTFYTETANAGAPTTGIGSWTTVGSPIAASGLTSIDTTANQTLDVTVQWSASSANNSWRFRSAILELI